MEGIMAKKAGSKSSAPTATKGAGASSHSEDRYRLPKQPVRLSDPEMQASVAELKKRIKADPGYGRQLLQETGILTATGRLSRRFGG